MGIITKEVEMTLTTRNVERLNNLGYILPKHWSDRKKDYAYNMGDKVNVKVEDLSKGSHALIEVECDYCHKVIKMEYRMYFRHLDVVSKYACKNCWYLKIQEHNQIVFGCKHASQVEQCKEKSRKTNQERRGVDYPTQSQKVKDKVRQTVIQNWNVDNIGKSPEIHRRMALTLYQNNHVRTSKQQKYLHQLYGGELNGVIGYYNCDIVFRDEKLCIELQGGGHWLGIIHGQLTQEEFNQKEIIRNVIIKKNGYKQVEIISRKDKLPSDEKLLEMLSYARNFFEENPQRSWISFDIDNSCVYNAYHKEKDGGLPYDFGELRKIRFKEQCASFLNFETINPILYERNFKYECKYFK